jgi:uncharacterized protein (TIGR02246 family)
MSITDPDADAKKQIEELVAQWVSATREKDIASLLELMTEDVAFLPAAGPAILGRAGARAVYERLFAQASLVESRPAVGEIQIAGDWAFLTGTDELVLTMAATGERMHLKGRAISILRRQSEGSWKFARGINNMLRQETTERK